MRNVRHWDDFYTKPLDDIPWEINEPPKELVELIDSGAISPGRALDIACGSGNYSIYLAKNGFDVTGIDFSKNAIDIARKNALTSRLKINFVVGDVMELSKLFPKDIFDFILDYSLLHHISPDEAQAYAGQCYEALKPGGKLLLVCYSEEHKRAKGRSKAQGKFGNDMYFRSAADIRKIYSHFKEISYKPSRLGKDGKHPAHCFLFEKADAL